MLESIEVPLLEPSMRQLPHTAVAMGKMNDNGAAGIARPYPLKQQE